MIDAVSVSALLKMFESFGGSIDFDSKTFSIKWMNFEVKGISFRQIKALSKNHGLIEQLLSEFFIQKRVMWFDLKRERTTECIASVEDLKARLNAAISNFSESNKDEDKLAATQLRLLTNISVDCINAFHQSVKDAEASRGSMDSSEWWEPELDIPEILSSFRVSAYPIIKWFCEILPRDNPVRLQAEAKLNDGEAILIGVYKVKPIELVDQEMTEE